MKKFKIFINETKKILEIRKLMKSLKYQDFKYDWQLLEFANEELKKINEEYKNETF